MTLPTPSYFIHPMVQLLKREDISEDMRRKLRARLSLNIGDTNSLRVLLGLDPEEFNAFYSDMMPLSPSTGDTIDTFLSQYAKTPQPDELQYAPAIDYAASFLNDDQEEETIPVEFPDSSAPQNDTSLSESLAKAMIKNHNYTKALEIITELSLKNPQKSVYFADQIRFLRKLIYLESRK